MSNITGVAPLRRRAGRGLRAAACLAPFLLAAGCAAFPAMHADAGRPAESSLRSNVGPGGVQAQETIQRSESRQSIPGRAPLTGARQPATEAQIAALVTDETVDATLAPQSIPQFVATVFGSVLNVPYAMSADVASRNEVIAGGTGGLISKRALFRLTQQALRQYGIEIYVDGGSVTVGGGEAAAIGAEVSRGRDLPGGAARVVQFFNVQTIEVSALQTLLQDLFPDLGGARITPDPLSNSLIISGSGRQVAQVIRVIREIDQPHFAGSEVLRIEPIFWSAENLAASLEQVMATEGYIISRQASLRRSVVLLSFPAANQILVFGQDPALLDRVRHWVDTLDRPATHGDKTSTFVYQVRNTDAQSLGQLAIGQTPSSAQAQAPVGVPGTPPAGTAAGAGTGANARSSSETSTPATGASGQFLNGRLLVDPSGNRIVFTGTAMDYAQLRDLLNTLDVPAPQVVIEVMIAEVTLTDETSIGVQLFGTQTRGDGVLSGSTEGLAAGGGAGVFTFIGADYRARLVANAKNDRVNILQTPRLVTRSGGTARFQVGQDVPIITSQRALDTQTGGNGSDVLQSVQYRQTGTILEITPVIYGERVDITISQELSSAGASLPGISSPIILNRSLTTQIAISDGWTGVLGGLISNNYGKVNTGLPFLKDIPIIGSAFQSNTVEGVRTELLLLITPRIVRGDEDMADFAQQYATDINAAFRTGRGWSYTLTPWSFGRGVRGIGIDLPSPEPASRRQPQDLRPEAGPAETQAAPDTDTPAD